MTRQEIIAAVEGEIGRLEQVHGLLKQSNIDKLVALATGTQKPAGNPRRTMSPEARRKIAQAQKARWAKQKSDAAAKK